MYQERQGEVGSLTKKSNFELKELLKRQNKILSNRSLVKNLPDGGAKLKLFVEQINAILEERGNVDSAANLMGTMSLDVQEKAVKGGMSKREKNQGGKTGSEGVPFTKGDKQFQTFHSNIFNKTVNESNGPFRPGRTLKSKSIPSNITKPEGYSKVRKATAKKEVSSAYYPPTEKESAKSIDLSESLRLQQVQQEKLDKLKAEQAAEKLAERLGIKIGEVPFDVETVGSFREPEALNSDDDDGEENSSERLEKGEQQLRVESSLDKPMEPS